MSSVGKEAGLTCEVSSAVSVLLQDVTLPTATAMGANTVLAQLVTHTPHGAVVKVFSIKQKKGQQKSLQYSLFVTITPSGSFTVLYTHTYACATVVAADNVSQRTSAGSSIR